MNWHIKKSHYIAGLVSILFFLGGCVADDTLTVSPETQPGISQGKRSKLVIPIRLRMAATASTRDTDDPEDVPANKYFDSDDPDATGFFDRGLAQENALYIPSPKEEDDPSVEEEEEESPGNDDPEGEGVVEGDGDNEDDNEDGDNEGESEGEEEEEEEEISTNPHHLLLIFDDQRKIVMEPIPVMDLTKSGTTEAPYYDTYFSLFMPEEEINSIIDKELSKFNTYIVLNASEELGEKLKAVKTYEDLMGLSIGDNSYTSLDGGLYLQKEGKTYFTMTSSIVVKDNSLIPAHEGTLKIYRSKEEALKDTERFTLYAERLQSKYTVIFQDGTDYVYLAYPEQEEEDLPVEEIEEYTRGTSQAPDKKEHLMFEKVGGFKLVKDYNRTQDGSDGERAPVSSEYVGNWRINITGWGINGLEREEYLFKRFSMDDYNKDWEKHEGKTFTYRNFWSIDKHYYNDLAETRLYPFQQRRVVSSFNPQGNEVVENLADASSNTNERMVNPKANLDYYSFYSLSQKNIRNYVPENTFINTLLGDDPFNTLTHLRVGSHLIITAQLLIKGIDSDPLYDNTPVFDEETGLQLDPSLTPAESKYLFNDMFWTEKAYKEYVAEYLGYFMATKENQNENKFNRNNGNFYVEIDGEYNLASASSFEIRSANVSGGDNKVHIYPVPGVTLYVYNPDHDEETDGYVEIFNEKSRDFAAQRARFLNLVYEHPELMAERYLHGMMYYAAPTYHFRNATDVTSQVKVGDFGTVRNNWYAYTVDAILKPGKGVDNPSQPIVPNNLHQEALGVSVKILDWHTKYTSSSVTGQGRPH